MFIPSTHSIIYHYQKEEKIFCNAKVIEGPEAPERGTNSEILHNLFLRSFIKRQTSCTTSDNERQRLVQRVTASGTTSEDE